MNRKWVQDLKINNSITFLQTISVYRFPNIVHVKYIHQFKHFNFPTIIISIILILFLFFHVPRYREIMDTFIRKVLYSLAYVYMYVYCVLCCHNYHGTIDVFMTSHQKRLTLLKIVLVNLLWPVQLIVLIILTILYWILRGLRWITRKLKRRLRLRRMVWTEDYEFDSSFIYSHVFMEIYDTLPTLRKLSDTEIKKLHIVYVTENSMPQYQLDGDSSCPICLSLISYRHQSDGSIITRDAPSDNEPCATTCHHVMHCGCLRDWLIKNPICPVCRQTQSITACRVLRIRNGETVPGGFTNANTVDLKTISTISSSSISTRMMPMLMSSNLGATYNNIPHVGLNLSSGVDRRVEPGTGTDGMLLNPRFLSEDSSHSNWLMSEAQSARGENSCVRQYRIRSCRTEVAFSPSGRLQMSESSRQGSRRSTESIMMMMDI